MSGNHRSRLLALAGAALVGLGATLGATALGAPAVAAPVGAIVNAGGAGAVADSYIVVLKAGTRATAVTGSAGALAQRYGGAVRRTYTAGVRGFAATMSAAAARRLAADPAVAYVEQDRVARVSATTQVNPTWGLDRVDQRDLPLSKTYTPANTGAGVTAYVLDTGIKISHPDFGGRASYGRDLVDNDAVADDCHGHGTHVAGTIGSATYGLAKQVSLVAVRVLNCQGSGTYSQILAGVDWVTRYAVKPAVANMSLGGGTTGSAALEAGVRASIASGVTYAVAAGNDNVDACTQTPARIAEAITVGATDSADARATFSNYGTCVDLFAPGVKIVSTSYTGGAATMNGTSMASPHVAGVAALVLAANPGYTPVQVRDTLVGFGTPGKVKSAGTGSPNVLLFSGVAAAAGSSVRATTLGRTPTAEKAAPVGTTRTRTGAPSRVPVGATR